MTKSESGASAALTSAPTPQGDPRGRNAPPADVPLSAKSSSRISSRLSSGHNGKLKVGGHVTAAIRKSTFMTLEETAEVIGVHPATLWRWKNRGIGPSFTKTGRYVFYLRAEVEAWCADPNSDRPRMGRPKKRRVSD